MFLSLTYLDFGQKKKAAICGGWLLNMFKAVEFYIT